MNANDIIVGEIPIKINARVPKDFQSKPEVIKIVKIFFVIIRLQEHLHCAVVCGPHRTVRTAHRTQRSKKFAPAQFPHS